MLQTYLPLGFLGVEKEGPLTLAGDLTYGDMTDRDPELLFEEPDGVFTRLQAGSGRTAWGTSTVSPYPPGANYGDIYSFI